MQWSIGKKFGLGFALTLVVFALIAGITVLNTQNLLAEARQVEQARAVLQTLSELEVALLRLESGGSRADVEGTLRELRAQLERRDSSSNAEQRPLDQEDFVKLEQLSADRLAGRGEMWQVQLVLERMRGRNEAELDDKNKDFVEAKASNLKVVALELTLALTMVLILGVLLIRDLTGPLKRLLEGTEQLGSGDLSSRVNVTTSDEVGQLGDAFNRMAAQLQQAAEERQAAQRELEQSHVELAVQIESLNRLNKEIQEVGRLTELLQSCLTSEEAYQMTAQVGLALFPAGGGLCMTSSSRNVVEMVGRWGEGDVGKDVFAPPDCWALRRGRPHVRQQEGEVGCAHLGCAGAAVCAPLVAQGEAFGILLARLRPGHEADETDLAAVVAEQLSLALANLKLRETLRNQSIRDPLTGLFNRRFMEESLDRELYRAKRQHDPLSILMFDIDHFKRFNDSFGHEAGDLVLKSVGQFLKASVRAEDIPCRYGGEEIALILPGATVAKAAERAESLRQGVEALSVTMGGQTLGTITISIGVAAYPLHGNDMSTVIAQADAALYRAKREGRNRVIVAETPTRPQVKG